jgi:hypothetical protein
LRFVDFRFVDFRFVVFRFVVFFLVDVFRFLVDFRFVVFRRFFVLRFFGELLQKNHNSFNVMLAFFARLWQRGIFYAPGTVDRVRIPPGHEDV